MIGTIMSTAQTSYETIQELGEQSPYEALIALICHEVESDPEKHQELKVKVGDVFSGYVLDEAIKSEPSRPSGPSM